MCAKPNEIRDKPILLINEKKYEKMINRRTPSRAILWNSVRAFLVGGFICFIGQCIQDACINYLGMTKNESANVCVAVLIFISVLCTALGVYDKAAQWAGAGTSVPVTGFANSMCSAALEHKTEGLVLGTGANMFKIAGPVIVFGVVAAFIVGLVYALFGIEVGRL